MEILDIDVDLIRPNPYQPRLDFEVGPLEELAASIAENGLIQPISLRKKDGFYQIIAGERRYRAAKLAGLKRIKGLVVDLEDEASARFALIENIQRQDLNIIEEALAYEEILRSFSLSQEELAKKLGKSRSYISNSIRLLRLPEELKTALIQGDLSTGHGKLLLSLKDETDQLYVFKEIRDKKLTIRQTKDLIASLSKEEKKSPDTYIKSLEEDLMNYFGTKVSLVQKKEKGIIEIEFYGEEDLGRILDMFS